jgi:pimeloyl-ACP methyl ester carboxylesterase
MTQLLKLTDGVTDRSATVIFVHGLGGGPRETWQRASDPNSFWPLWLAKDIPGLMVYSVDYEAPISRWRGAAMHLTDRARSLLACLLAEPDLQHGPLILIGHSLGGLVIKQLLRTAEIQRHYSAEAASFIRRVAKVAFLATPHAGSGLGICSNLLRILIRPSPATASLLRNDPNLRDLNLWYRDWANVVNINHLVLVETSPTPVLGMIVKPDSSDPGFVGSQPVPIDANHAEICKPRDRSSPVYVQVRAFIERRINPPPRLGERHLDAVPLTNIQTGGAIPGTVIIVNNNTINIDGNREKLEQWLKTLEARLKGELQ